MCINSFQLYRVKAWLIILVLVVLSGCSLTMPLPDSTPIDERRALLKGLNVDISERVEIHWNDYAIPFIVADSDEDAAYALGVVHAHLRLGQMEMIKRISQGRISEMVGIFAQDIDIALRTLDITRAVPQIVKQLPPKTRIWLERYTAGINAYKAQRPLPFEFEVMDLKDELWTIEDTLGIVRLTGLDVNWFSKLSFIKHFKKPDWQRVEKIWKQQRVAGVGNSAAYKTALGLLSPLMKTGSNSWVVAAERTKNKSALMASDPHLGFSLPNAWLLVGLKSPSYHVSGAMVAGIPVFAFGRNPDLSWGGTHMRAAVSDFIDSTALELTTHNTTFTSGLLGNHIEPLWESEQGPCLCSVALLDKPKLAVRWIGHRPSDEITALLGVMKARSGFEMAQALETYALPSQNFLYAEKSGAIGQLFGVQIPNRGKLPWPLVYQPKQAEQHWQHIVKSTDLPHIRNPKAGFIVSANNAPTTATITPVGNRFSHRQRYQRAYELLATRSVIDLNYLKKMQLDVYSAEDERFNHKIIDLLKQNEIKSWLMPALKQWDGRYAKDSSGAVAYEAVRYGLHKNLSEFTTGTVQVVSLYEVSGQLNQWFEARLAALTEEQVTAILHEAVALAQSWLDPSWTWNDVHRIKLNHPLSYIPILGSQYTFADIGAAGSRNTLNKSAHASSNEVHVAFYGSQARHISSMDDMDNNYFILLGGQDGWLTNSQLTGMVSLWETDKLLQFPLRLKTIRAQFSSKTHLKPPTR